MTWFKVIRGNKGTSCAWRSCGVTDAGEWSVSGQGSRCGQRGQDQCSLETTAVSAS